uniref:G-protein coupled receptors family 1 profile domain-containing protein n=2 Tax=Meloidogyne TaxID=189290 RepID=A0A914N304_MELIC
MDVIPSPHQQQLLTEVSAGPPEKITSDYIELISLIILFIIGAPLNLAAWTQISEKPVSSRLDMLKKHLNYSDLLVLFIYVPSRACWLVTYDWRGGDLLCRLIKFAHTFAFQISSNVIVCIALDRLLSVLSVSHRNPGQATCRMRIMLLIAWIAAAVISAPQFVVWKLYQAFDNPPWSQCMQIWEIERSQLQRNNNFHLVSNDSTIKLLDSKLLDEESIYMILHMLLIFWIPACIIMLCYLLLSCWVYINSKPNFFDLVNSAEKDGIGEQQIQMVNLLNNQQAQQNQKHQTAQNASNGGGGGMLVALRSSRVSYQLAPINNSTTTQGHETQNTTLFTNNISNIESPKTKKPMIVLNDEMLLSLSPSQSPQPGIDSSEVKQNKHLNGIAEMVKQRENEQRNSSTTSNEAAAALLLASKRQRQSSSYSAKSQRNRAIRVSFLLVMGYFICWLPYNCLSLLQFIYPELYSKHASKVYNLNGIIVFNSVINPYLYGLCGGLCRQGRRNS